MSVSRETLDLNHYEDLLKQWNKTINLIAPSTEQSLRERHIDDSLQLPRLIAPTRQSCADFGSGGGLPGIVYAIATREQAAPITLVESDQRKAAFLRACIREIGLSHATVIARRVEEMKSLDVDLVTARGLAPLEKLLPLADRHLRKGGAAWFMKGKNWQQEVENAGHWHFTLDVFPSKTDPDAAILKLTDIEPCQP